MTDNAALTLQSTDPVSYDGSIPSDRRGTHLNSIWMAGHDSFRGVVVAGKNKGLDLIKVVLSVTEQSHFCLAVLPVAKFSNICQIFKVVKYTRSAINAIKLTFHFPVLLNHRAYIFYNNIRQINQQARLNSAANLVNIFLHRIAMLA